ncbi:MAG TPA: hypothetical protein VLF93_03530 [Candidatus Saccharimonadales bacterium]|nr:hypothetical protein [Candidatus Saccharimonadales bacterium]
MIKRLLLICYILSLFLLVVPQPAQAVDWGGCVQDGVATLQCIPIVFSNIVTAALEFVGAVAVILLVYAGIRLVTSGGDPKQVNAARQIITYAIIGLVVVLSSFAIIFLISYLTGAHCIETFSFSSCK